MALDNKYGKIDIPGIPDDEPVFIIRAKDNLAIDSILDYQRRATHAYLAVRREPSEFTDGLEEVIEQFVSWTETHADKMKLPD